MATRVSHLPPVGSLFAAFLGYNPMQILLGPRRAGAPAARHAAYLTSRQFFPHLISPAFSRGADRGLLLRRRRVPPRRRGLAAAGRQVPPQEETETAPSAEPRDDWVPAQEAVAETEPLLVD